MAGVAGVPQGEGPRLSPRIVDDPASRPPRSRARTGAGTCVSRQSGAGHGVQILDQEEVKPHKVRYYLEQRDPDFAEKMAKVLCVYRQVKILKQAAAVSKAKKTPSDAVAIISYDEKPGIQAIATTAPDLPPEPSDAWPGLMAVPCFRPEVPLPRSDRPGYHRSRDHGGPGSGFCCGHSSPTTAGSSS